MYLYCGFFFLCLHNFGHYRSAKLTYGEREEEGFYMTVF